ncbi:MAG: two-component regulator propeller domain-containing protein, partial [Pricia sp.]
MHPFDLIKLFILLCSLNMVAQDAVPDYYFHPIKESSSQRAVSSIVQDRDGLMWMGTNGVGLSRFNGIDFTYYQQQSNDTTSISGSLVYDTYIDGEGRLWVGTQAGLDLYDRACDRFIKIDIARDKEVSGGTPVKSIADEPNGNLIVGTLQHGAFMIDGKTMRSEPIPINGIVNLDALLVNSVASHGGRSFIGTNSGLFEYRPREKQFVPFEIDASAEGNITD